MSKSEKLCNKDDEVIDLSPMCFSITQRKLFPEGGNHFVFHPNKFNRLASNPSSSTAAVSSSAAAISELPSPSGAASFSEELIEGMPPELFSITKPRDFKNWPVTT